MKFAVSTTAFRRIPIESVIQTAKKAGFCLEFSSGLPFRADMREIYLRTDVPRLPHNYFPAPAEPFVLNLASMNPAIFDQSVQHCLQGLQLALDSGAPFFSAHAGFCLDPSPRELGKKFQLTQQHPRKEHWSQFISGLKKVCAFAESIKTQFLIENNVVPSMNVLPDGSSPLLCTDWKESAQALKEVESASLGLLLDTGHLLVSANTFKFSAEEYINSLCKSIQAIHHSDNDALEDSNHPIGNNYWFLRYMPLFSDAYHILEVHDQSIEEIFTQRSLLKNAIQMNTQEQIEATQ